MRGIPAFFNAGKKCRLTMLKHHKGVPVSY
jgi:hypothetical protein